MSDNMKLWNAVCKTDPNHTKQAKKGGNTFTAIDAQYQRKIATEQFGMYGVNWGLNFNNEFINYKELEDTVLAIYRTTFYYEFDGKKGEFPVCSSIMIKYKTSSGYYKIDDDFVKKLQTDALTKGLSFLGFNADVFLGLYDDNKYIAELKKEFQCDDSQISQSKHDSTTRPECPNCSVVLYQNKNLQFGDYKYYCWKDKGGCGKKFNNDLSEYTNGKSQSTDLDKKRDELIKKVQDKNLTEIWFNKLENATEKNIDALEKAINQAIGA